MKRIFKWICIAAFSFILLAMLVVGTAYRYKADILAAVTTELKKTINGDIHIGNIEFNWLEHFPSFTITLKDIYLRGLQYERYHKDFLNAEWVSLDIEIVSFLQKHIVIRAIRIMNGNIFIFKTTGGYTNLDVFKNFNQKDSTSAPSATVTFRKISLNNVHVSYQDSLKKKSFGFHFLDTRTTITSTDSSRHFLLTGPVEFDGLTFNEDKGSFLKAKNALVRLNVEFVPSTHTLSIHPSMLRLSQSDITVSGHFQFTSGGNFMLQIESDKLNFAEGNSLLTSNIQSKLKKYAIEKPVAIVTMLRGTLGPGMQPLIDIKFQFNDSRILNSKVKIEHATVTGLFSNHADDTKPPSDNNAVININNFNGVIEDLPTRGWITFRNLKDPYVNLHSTIALQLPALNEKLDTARMKFLAGSFVSKVEYTGTLADYLGERKTPTGKLKGSVNIKDGIFEYLPRKQLGEHINMALRFTNDSLIINNCTFHFNKSPMSITGEILGFIPFFHQPEKKGTIKLVVSSPAFDLASLIAVKPSRKLTLQQRQDKRKKISDMMDKLYDKVEFDISVQVDKLNYHNFQGSNLHGRVVLAHNTLQAKGMKMNLADGAMNFSLSLTDLQNTLRKFSITGTVQHADIRKFFYSFDNFNQSAVNHNNLEGTLNMSTTFHTDMNEEFVITPSSMKGTIDLFINQGKLDNFAPLQRMGNFLFKKRDFDIIEFGEIHTRFTLDGTELEINRMEVESSVLRLFLEGRYSFADSTNLSIQIPLSNLKKRDKNYEPKNMGVDTKAGPSIFLHVYKDNTGKTVIAYDPFKKHVRKPTL